VGEADERRFEVDSRIRSVSHVDEGATERLDGSHDGRKAEPTRRVLHL